MATVSTLLTQLRTLCRDLPTSNRSVKETPKGLNDGTNKRFSLQSPILVDAAHIWWSSGNSYRVQTGIVVDDANLGYITIDPAPPAGSQNTPFFVDYYYNWFADSDYAEFLNDGSRDLVGNGDPTTVVDGLVSALLQYAMAHYWQARANQYAARYASSGGMAGQSVDKVADRFNAWADAAFKSGQNLRDQFYEDLGQRSKAASGIINYAIDPITPRE